MARPGVTLLEVAKAAEAIQQAGVDPTVDRIREHIGSGSKSTLAPLLKEWKSKRSGRSDLPAELTHAVATLYQRLQSDADDQITQAAEAFNAERDSLESQLKQATHKIEDQAASFETLDARYRALSEQNDLRKQQLKTQALELAKSNTHNEQLQAQLEEKREALSVSSQDIQSVRAQLEHFQQQTSEDRRQEREQVTEAQFQFSAQLNQNQKRLEDFEKQRQIAQTQLVEQGLLLEQSKHSTALLEQQLSDLRAKTDVLSQKNISLSEAVQSREARQNKLEQARNSLQQTVISLEEQLEARNRSRAKNETLISELTQEVRILNADKLELVQEAAVLDGRLQQLGAEITP